MQIKAQKYRVLGALNLILLLLVFYSCNKHLESSVELRFSNIVCFIVYACIVCYLLKIYKDEYALVLSYLKVQKIAKSNADLLVNMSHEIRTPLNSVIGFSEQLGQSKLDGKQAEQLHAIRSSSVILLDLVNDILDFSKYETYGVSFDRVPFSPFDAINEVVNGIAIQASQKGVELKTEISFEELIYFKGDSLRLKQVVMNLLSNAIKFTQKGSVTLKADVVTLSAKQGILNIQIIDTGIGINPINLEMIFDEFVQVNYSSTQVKEKGTGLGLAICKKIVEFQEGGIKVASELGKGSVFSFSIPYEICNEIALESKHTTGIDSANLIGKRILIADDNKMNLLLAKTVINKYKMSADIAYDGEEALVLFEKNKYDLVLTDIQMPKMNGIALAKAIRLSGDTTKLKTPILGVTANVLAKDREFYLQAGMNDCVLKPFSEHELIDKIAFQILGLACIREVIEN
jgi:CheY-like chemotaxis protein/nitrogen-specific signal transduction histidine kinase